MNDSNGEQVCRWHSLIEPWRHVSVRRQAIKIDQRQKKMRDVCAWDETIEGA